MVEPLPYTVYQYGKHELQRVGVWDLDINSDTAEWYQYWIIYIHGGAWRDPRITHRTFEPSIAHLRHDVFAAKHVEAFASIDYRLSPHPDFPQDIETTPADQYRDARHPDHVDDVISAVRFLQEKFGFGDRYVLVGHSCGATLAYQMIADKEVGSGTGGKVVLPAAVCGFEGIYDFRGLNDRKGGEYAEFISGAFGSDEMGWDAASPVQFADGTYAGTNALYVLAHSPDDELVDMPETDGMAARLLADSGRPDQLLVVRDLRGKHDDIWEDGEGISRVVSRTLRCVKEVFRRDEDLSWSLGERDRRRAQYSSLQTK